MNKKSKHEYVEDPEEIRNAMHESEAETVPDEYLYRIENGELVKAAIPQCKKEK